ncbi:MAG: 5'/3'-nucleotidase SurE [Corallococcus sp.]|nr:5'/3'-nucleotidase SurE [Corallococcus sp.]
MHNLNILLTNDDGYEADGLKELCRLLSQNHNVYVVAPDSQRSAFSHAMQFFKEITFLPIENYCGAVKAYSSSGTPADCVKFATMNLDVKFDLLISGINNGENYGLDIPYSGTVGAAEEGTICGIKSVAVSRLGNTGGYQNCIEFIDKYLMKILEFNIQFVFLNVNVPADGIAVKDVKAVRQGTVHIFADYYLHDKNAPYEWRLCGDKIPLDKAVCCDVVSAEEGFITITPLKIDCTDYDSLQKVKGIFE